MAVADETKLHKKTKVVEKYIDSSETDEYESIESGDDMESEDDVESGDDMESENESLIEGKKDEEDDMKETKDKQDALNNKSKGDINDDNESGDELNSDDGSINGDDENDSDSDSDISDIPDTFDSGGEGDAESDDEDNESSGTGLGAVMSSILKTQKKRGLILSKAKKDYEIRLKERESDDDEFEVLEEGGTVTKVKKESEKKEAVIKRVETEREIMLRRKEWENMSRVWPDIQADREKERKLRILATQGVVQLLGAIDKHAKSVDKKLSEARGELQKDKVLETTGKEAFMAVLRQEGEKVNKSNTQTTEVKTEVKEEPDERITLPSAKRPRWGVLADNFYNEPTLDGWDKESDEE